MKLRILAAAPAIIARARVAILPGWAVPLPAPLPQTLPRSLQGGTRHDHP